MKRTTICCGLAVAGILLFGAGCSNNSKVAENSAVESRGDGKGTAPSSAAAKEADRAMVRFVNGTTAKKDVAFGDVTAFDGVGDRDITAYKELPAERHEFKLLTSGDKAVLASDSEGLSAGKHYTLLAVTEKGGKVTLHNVGDDLTPPDAGKAKVRVINLVPAMAKVDLYDGHDDKDAIISGATLNSPTDYKTVDPANAHLNIRNGTSKKHSVPIKDVDLKSGKLYTILVFQDKKGSIKTKTIEDAFSAAPNGVTKTSS
ncbi:MAG: DUF4397 domain-containing protein [Bryobacteraceae bacterium]